MELGIPNVLAPEQSSSRTSIQTGIVRGEQGQDATILGEPVNKDEPAPSSAHEPTPSSAPVQKTSASRVRVPKPMSEVEKELRNTLAETRAALRKCQNSKKKFKTRLIMASKIVKTSAFQMLSEKMTPSAKTFFHIQIKQFGKKTRGRRFSLEEKILALSVYKPCPKAYKILSKICILPKRRTLDKILQKVNLLPGINEMIFYHLKKRVNKMASHHKLCTILFDEMAIAPHVAYDKSNDMITGIVDNGTEREKNFCDHVLVFMVRGVIKKFKQPIAFTFCKGSTKTNELKRQIETVIKKVTESGLKVIGTVCDQGATNMAALNVLMNQTKEMYIKNNKMYKGGFFEVDGKKIYPIYDPPHVMKGIRNNLLTKDLEYVMDGKVKKAKWAHLEALYRRGPGYKSVRLVNKLTTQHVVPNLIPKMRVKFCTQVFSENVGVTMGYMSGVGKLPKESTDTADILLFFDKLFDSVNGSFSKPVRGKEYRSAVTPRSPHHKLWYKSLPILKTMKYVNKNGTKSIVPSISSWIKTIEAFQAITKYLHSQGLNSLLLRHFNQDPLENFFGSIRAHGLRNTKPSASAFTASYKALMINNLTSPHSVGSNCEEDKNSCLQSLKFFLTKDVKKAEKEEIVINEEHLDMPLVETENLIKTANFNGREKCAAIAYCSGWLAQTAKKIIYKHCKKCKSQMENDNAQEFHSFIKIKEYKQDKTWLCYPTREVFDYFCRVKNIVIDILKSSCHITILSEYIELITSVYVNTNFLTCKEHKDTLSKFMLKKCISFFINNWCKEINHILSGKVSVWDEEDPMKRAANIYCSVHKRKGQRK